MRTSLQQYVREHARRVARGTAGAVDVVFCGVLTLDGQAEELRKAIATHAGEFCDVNVFDGKEHSYIELGGWLGDQGLALEFMAIGSQLGLFELLTPRSMLGNIPASLEESMAGNGYIGIRTRPPAPARKPELEPA